MYVVCCIQILYLYMLYTNTSMLYTKLLFSCEPGRMITGSCKERTWTSPVSGRFLLSTMFAYAWWCRKNKTFVISGLEGSITYSSPSYIRPWLQAAEDGRPVRCLAAVAGLAAAAADALAAGRRMDGVSMTAWDRASRRQHPSMGDRSAKWYQGKSAWNVYCADGSRDGHAEEDGIEGSPGLMQGLTDALRAEAVILYEDAHHCSTPARQLVRLPARLPIS